MAEKTKDEKHQEEVQAIAKEIIELQDKEGVHLAFDPEAILAERKRQEEDDKSSKLAVSKEKEEVKPKSRK